MNMRLTLAGLEFKLNRTQKCFGNKDGTIFPPFQKGRDNFPPLQKGRDNLISPRSKRDGTISPPLQKGRDNFPPLQKGRRNFSEKFLGRKNFLETGKWDEKNVLGDKKRTLGPFFLCWQRDEISGKGRGRGRK